MTARCARCDASIECNPGPDCWCAALPFLPMPNNDERCLCAACLERVRVLGNYAAMDAAP
jgi:hypothetical protein